MCELRTKYKMLTSIYSAQISMLLTKSHTWATVHELISSLWAWQRRWLDAFVATPKATAFNDVAFEPATTTTDGVWARLRVVDWDGCSCVAGGEPKLRTGLGDSIFIRFVIGVEALRSNGDAGRMCVSFELLPLPIDILAGVVADAAVVWLTDVAVNDWLISDDAFCCNDMYCNAFGTFDRDKRFCGDVFGFDDGDCCWWWCWRLFDNKWDLVGRFVGPFKICWISASFATRAFTHEKKKEKTIS